MATLDQDDLDAIAALLLSGGVNLVQIDGNPTNDNSATLTLKQLDIRGGATDDAVIIMGGGTSGDGISISTTDGHGISITSSGVSDKNGIIITANSGEGILVEGGDGYSGIYAGGTGTGPGLLIQGGATGDGISIVAGGASGDGINVYTYDGHGIDISVSGAGKYDINAPNSDIGVNVTQIGGDATSATNLRESTKTIYAGSVTGAATSTSLIDSALTQTATNHWYGRIILFTSGALKYQATDIVAFDPATDTLTFTELTGAPGLGDAYVIV